MACFLSALVDRNAVVNLPEYIPLRQGTVKENQVTIDTKNRHGGILGVTSNQDTFSFGIRFKDAQIINLLEDEQIGAYRTFLMTDLDGNLYSGCNSLEFVPTYKENEWFYNNIWKNDSDVSGNVINFKNFINPNKWVSFYGQYYFIAKSLEKRLVEQIQYMNNLISEMQKQGVKFSLKTGRGKYWQDISHNYGHFKSEKIWEFESDVYYPENDSQYPTLEFNKQNLEALNKRVKSLTKSLAKIRYHLRTVEYAFANKHRHLQNGDQIFVKPSWIDADWELNYRDKGKKSYWNRLKLIQPGVGEKSVSIKFSWVQRTEKVRDRS